MNFGKRLRQVRMDRKMTQPALSEQLHIPLRTYQNYEQGSREPSFATLVALADILDVTTDYLLCRDEHE